MHVMYGMIYMPLSWCASGRFVNWIYTKIGMAWHECVMNINDRSCIVYTRIYVSLAWCILDCACMRAWQTCDIWWTRCHGMNDFIWLKDKQGDVCSSLLAASHYIDSHSAWDLPDFCLYDLTCSVCHTQQLFPRACISWFGCYYL